MIPILLLPYQPLYTSLLSFRAGTGFIGITGSVHGNKHPRLAIYRGFHFQNIWSVIQYPFLSSKSPKTLAYPLSYNQVPFLLFHACSRKKQFIKVLDVSSCDKSRNRLSFPTHHQTLNFNTRPWSVTLADPLTTFSSSTHPRTRTKIPSYTTTPITINIWSRDYSLLLTKLLHSQPPQISIRATG